MDLATKRLVRERAASRCEYCQLHQDDDPLYTFHIEHIIAKQHGGSDEIDNLCLSCHQCNLLKGPNLSSIDGQSRKVVRLFHPRQQRWSRHFQLDGPYLVGRTQSGRATIDLLQMNSADRIFLRQLLIAAGRFPAE